MLQSWYSRTWQIFSQSLQLKMSWNVSNRFLISLKKQEVNGTIKSPFSIPCPRSKKKCFRAGILAPRRYSLSRSTVKVFWNVNRFPISIAATLLVSSRRSSGTRLWLPSTKSSTKIRVTNVLPLTPNWRGKHATDDLLVLTSSFRWAAFDKININYMRSTVPSLPLQKVFPVARNINVLW